MSKLTPLLSKKLQWILFGTLDRTVATISLLLGIVSFIFSLWTYWSPKPSLEFFYVRDILILATLISIITLLALKLLVVETKADRFRMLLLHQLEANYQMITKFRNHFFSEIRNPLFEKTVNLDIERYSHKVFRSLLTDTRELFQDYYDSR